MNFTVSGASVAGLLGYLESRRVDVSEVVGFDREALLQPDCRVPASVNDALWAAAVARTGEADLGLRFALRLDLDAFHLVGHLAASSATVGEALERVVAFSRLLHDAGRTEVERVGDRVLLFPGCRGLPAPAPPPIAEFNAASAVVLIRFVTEAPEWAPRAVEFRHRAPTDVAPHRALFGVAPHFGATEDVVELSPEDLALPVRVERRSRVGLYLEDYARTLLASLPAAEDDLPSRIRRTIVSSLPAGGFTLEDVAARLAMTSRTLQRRLAEAGVSFSVLVDDARRAVAEQHLRGSELSLAEIAWVVGFREESSFHKAFRRWTGESPGAWRARKPPREVG